MLKYKAELIWITPQAQAQTCGEYKTEHHICVEVKHPIPVLSKGTTLQVPTIKFALHLNDTYAPDPVQNALFVSFVGLQSFTFAASPSEDVSYYLLTCNDGPKAFVNGRKDYEKLNAQFLVSLCNGQPFVATQAYKLTVTPVDLSGNNGKAVTCNTQSQQVTQVVTGVAIPVSCV